MSFKGDIRILYLKDTDGVYKPVACLTSNNFEEDADMLLTTTSETDGWETSIPTTQRFNIPFEGIQVSEGGKFSYLEIKQLKRDGARIEWRITDDTGTFVDEGFGHITEIGESAQAGDFLRFSGNIKGYGKPLIVTSEGDLWMDGTTMIFMDGTAMIF